DLADEIHRTFLSLCQTAPWAVPDRRTTPFAASMSAQISILDTTVKGVEPKRTRFVRGTRYGRAGLDIHYRPNREVESIKNGPKTASWAGWEAIQTGNSAPAEDPDTSRYGARK
ncbi:MAG TPA: hypothetical protein VGJ26_08090, partial [Pirellulales bacterium]